MNARILVVEDNEVNREVARVMLETLRCEVDVAVEGEHGFACGGRVGAHQDNCQPRRVVALGQGLLDPGLYLLAYLGGDFFTINNLCGHNLRNTSLNRGVLSHGLPRGNKISMD